jgi:hypothetical protein
MAKAVSGGGISSRVVKQVDIKSGSPNLTAYSPRGVSQIGAAQGSRLDRAGSFTTRNSALPYSDGQRKDFVPLGNSLTNNIGPGGPGSGRVLYGQGGTQQMHGAPVQGQSPGRRDILSEFGREPTSQDSLVRK